MKWFFAMNAASLGRYETLIRVAARSAAEHTRLLPNFLFDGAPCALTDDLARLGVIVHFKESSVAREIDARPETDGFSSKTARGAYLRLDIPEVETADNFVLYTDVDVMFERDYDWDSLRPSLMMAAPEYDTSKEIIRQSSSVFNSGVMVMNLPECRRTFAGFKTFIRLKRFFFHGVGGFYDQGAINAYFSEKIEPLPNELNYRIFASVADKATIVHFHGPKPDDIDRLMRGDSTVYPLLRELYERNPTGYHKALERFISYSKNDFLSENGGTHSL